MTGAPGVACSSRGKEAARTAEAPGLKCETVSSQSSQPQEPDHEELGWEE